MNDRRRNRVTVRQVAERAGVSQSTVSRLLNDQTVPVMVREETKQRVFQAAKELGYRPNRLARGLVKQETRIIGLCIPLPPPHCCSRDLYELHANLVGKLVTGVQNVAVARDYDLHIVQRPELSPEGTYTIPSTSYDFLDGLVYAKPSSERSYHHVFITEDIPLVMIGKNPGPESVSCVYVDNELEVSRVTKALLLKGHTKIGLILPGGSELETLAGNRYRGYIKGFEESGYVPNPKLIAHYHISDTSRDKCITQLLSAKPTAIIVCQIGSTFSLLQALSSSRIRCPEDIEVVVFGDDPAFASFSPSLTALDICTFTAAIEATQMLCDELNGDAVPGREMILPARLLQRQSCELNGEWERTRSNNIKIQNVLEKEKIEHA